MRIFVVSTEIGEGRGGISTALVGLKESRAFSQLEIHYLSSHAAGKKLLGFKCAMRVAKNIHSEDLVWLHCGPWFSIFRKTLIALVAKMKGAKVVFHFHSPKMDDYCSRRVSLWLLSLVVRLADGIIVLTPWWEKRFLQVFPSIQNKMHVSPNPLDSISAQSDIQSQRSKINEVKLLTMARLAEGKGVDDVIKLMPLLPLTYTLTIAGDGPLMGQLKALVSDLQLNKRVEFKGWVNYKNKHKLLCDHDIFILPSRYDSFGMVYIEAMAQGLPVVALDHQAIPDVVPNKSAGFLCRSEKPEHLQEGIKYCVANQDKIREHNMDYARIKFDREVIAESLSKYFKELN